MDRYIRCAAYFLNIAFAITVLVFIANAYRTEHRLLGLAALLLPFVNICALRHGPDREEVALLRQVRKARLRAELGQLSK
ncbi:MAG TPA: hypothetical protein VEF76_04065 [Patescibacteria group bacterium]|nr:hypothetical protein [Patescibacteria group bacterium]